MSRFNLSTRKLTRLMVLTSMLVVLSTGAFGQNNRSVKSKVTPAYPELAKRMNVIGAVKVELTVAANGSVKTAKALGGHPLLIDAAVNAAKQFKYEPGEETKEVVEFKFNGNGNN
ncbi:MAG TPA: energy transducer TonB [Terriglobales bacterium]|nr:energy transducer TonB [Terriglobales bacterium]